MLDRAVIKLILALGASVERFVGPRADAVMPAREALDPARVRRLILWSMNSLGDVVRTTPAIRALREQYPGAHITMVAAGRAAPILREHPCIDEMHQINNPFSLRDHRGVLKRLRAQEPYDLAVMLEVNRHWVRLGGWWLRSLGVPRWLCFDFGGKMAAEAIGVQMGEEGSWIDQFNRLAAATGAVADSQKLEIRLSEDERAWAQGFLAEHGIPRGEPFVLIHPGANVKEVSRRWPPEHFARLITELRHRRSMPIVITGTTPERPLVGTIRRHTVVDFVDFCGRLNMRQLAAVIDAAALCIMNDTGPLHVAHALAKSTVAILGPTAPQVVGLPATTKVARLNLACSPCAYFDNWKSCLHPHRHACLEELTPEAVLAVVQRQLPQQVTVRNSEQTAPLVGAVKG